MSNTIQNINDELNVVFNSSCKCADCESGVSPLSYFTDLLKYAYKNLRRDAGNGLKPLIDFKTPTSIDTATEVFTLAGHGLLNGTPLYIGDAGGLTGTGWAKGNLIYIKDRSASMFKVSATSGGSAINLSGTLGTAYFYTKGSIPGYSFFKNDFYQYIEDFPISCSTVNNEICQARYAIETLYNYRAENAALSENALNNYLSVTYHLLLTMIGTSFDEIRLIQGVGEKQKEKLAKKIGIKFTAGANDVFSKLLLTIDSENSETELSETNLERIFGLINTRKDPFSTGVILNNPGAPSNPFVLRWHFEKTEWKTNTDEHGKLYFSRTGTNEITVYKDANKTKIVAIGIPLSDTSTTYKFVQKNNSSIKGFVILKQRNIPPDISFSNISFSIIPQIVCWKLLKLEEIWGNNDEKSESPLIDPDFIGIKDIKSLYDSGTYSIISTWESRNSALQNKYNAVKSERENNSSTDLLNDIDSIYKPIYFQKSDEHTFFVLNSDVVTGGADPINGRNKYISKLTDNGGSDWFEIAKGSANEQLDDPESIYVHQENIYVADTDNYRIKCFDTNSSFKWSINFADYFSGLSSKKPKSVIFDSSDNSLWATFGSFNKMLKINFSSSYNNINYILDGSNEICFDSFKNSYEVITAEHKIVKKDPTGIIVWMLGKKVDDSFVSGSGDGQFNSPDLVILGKDGYLYINDANNDRIQQISTEGNFIRSFSVDPDINDPAFGTLSDIKQDQAGNIFIVDKGNHRIIRQNKYGIYTSTIGSEGSDDGQFTSPSSIAIDKENNIYVVDTGNHRIQIFNREGEFIAKIGTGSSTTSNDGFNSPSGIAIGYDQNGNTDKIYVADKNNNRIQIFDRNGSYSSTITDSSFILPNCVAIDSSNRIFIGSTTSQKLVVRDIPNDDWKVITTYAGSNLQPTAIFIMSDNNIAVADDLNNNLVFFTNALDIDDITFNYKWGNLPNEIFSVSSPLGFCINSESQVWLTDGNNIIRTALPAQLSLPSSVTPKILRINDLQQIYVSSSNKVFRNDKGEWTTVISSFSGEYYVDNLDYVYMHDSLLVSGSGTVHKYSPEGTEVTSFELSETFAAFLDKNFTFYSIGGGSLDIIRSQTQTLGLNNALVESIGASYNDFVEINALLSKGLDVEKILRSWGLTYETFNYIKTINDFINIGSTIQENEWTDIYNILLNAHKRKTLYPEWKEYETTNNIFIKPYEFNYLSENEESEIVINKWRTSFKERRVWRRLLQGRNDTYNEIFLGNKEMISTVEENRLPVLRDLLIIDEYTVVPDIYNIGVKEKADWLSKRLLIDMANNCCSKTNRISMAIEVLQGIFFGIKTGNLNDFIEEYDYGIADGSFDNTWKTLGSYASWRSAMFINFYPENLLLPTLRKTQSRFFRQIASDISVDERFSPESAIDSSTKYGEYIADISNIDVQTSIYCDISKAVGSGAIGTTKTLFMFGLGRETGSLYYCTLESEKDITSNLKDWIKLDQLKKIYYLVGAVEVYDAKDETCKIALLAITKQENNMSTISMINYNVQTGVWSGEQEDLDITFHQEATTNPTFPFPLGGIHAVLVRNPYNTPFKYEDRENWGNFNIIGETHFMPALSLSFWGKTYMGYLDFKNRKITHTVNNNGDLKGYVGPGALFQVGSGFNNTFLEISIDVEGYKPFFRILDKLGKPKINRQHIFQLVGSDFVGAITEKSAGNSSVILSFWKNRTNNLIKCIAITVDSNGASYSSVNIPSIRFTRFRIIDPSNAKRNGFSTTGNDRLSVIVNTDKKTEIMRYSYSGGSFYFVSGSNRSLSPYIPAGPYMLSSNYSGSAIETLRQKVRSYLTSAVNNTDIAKSYIEEAFYGIPFIIAQQLQKKAYYKEALDWYQLIYDYTRDLGTRKIYYGLVLEENLEENLNRPTDWLSDPTNPHNTAKTRRDSYTKFTIQAIVRCLIEFADNEFTKDNVESVARARELYLDASMLIRESSLLGGSSYEARESQIRALERSSLIKDFLSSANDGQIESWQLALSKLRRLQSPRRITLMIQGPLTTGTKPIITIITLTGTIASKLISINNLLDAELNANVFEPCELQIKALNDNTATQEMFEGAYSIWMDAWEEIKGKLNKIESPQRLKVIINSIGSPDRPLITIISDGSLSTKEKLEEMDDLLSREISKQIKTQSYFGIEDENRKRKQLAIQAILADQARVSGILKDVEVIKTNYHKTMSELTGLKPSVMISTDKSPQIAVQVFSSGSWGSPVNYAFKASFLTQAAVKVTKTVSRTTVVSTASSVATVSLSKVMYGETLGATVRISPTNFVDGHVGASIAKVAEVSPSVNNDLKNKATTEYLAKLNDANRQLQEMKSKPPKPVALLSLAFCMPQNPVAQMYLMYAEMNLYKLRNCMNIAGVVRELNPFAAPTDATSGMPYIGIGGQMVTPGQPSFRPTIYRYDFLIERAKQLVNIAQQMESAMLVALEKFDSEKYAQLQARQQIKLSRANITLSSLRVEAAKGEERLAELNKEKAVFTRDHFDGLISAGLNGWESAALTAKILANAMGVKAIAIQTAAVIEEAFKIIAGTSAGKVGNVSGESAKLFGVLQNNANNLADLLSSQATYARREQEWQFSKNLAGKDVEIGNQQIKQAQTGVRIAGQESKIAELQQQNNEDTLNFLLDKFTNAELYAWMSGVLQRVYTYFLHTATGVAVQAQNQLAFERQEYAPEFIKTDYWEAPVNPGDQKSSDRKGLTGSARLLQDIYMLDQHAIDTDTRKLQMSKTFSLATQFPVEFEKFRQTGVLPFSTLMPMFDKDFPGHYLRLIKSVKTSVIALIPPTEGIKATLSSTGSSSVVVKNGVFFQKVPLSNKGSETVALTSAINASGMFEMQAVTNKLNPFEGIGVEAGWVFTLPKASNAFSFNTIADIQVTMEYTALSSFEYKTIMLKELDSDINAQRTFSFKNSFPDQWYDLSNQINPNAPSTIDLEISKFEYPSNLIEDPLISKISFLFTYTGDKKDPITISTFNYAWKEDGADKSKNGSGGESVSLESENKIIGTIIKSDQGEWTKLNTASALAYGKLSLTFENTDSFKQGEVDDVLLIIEYTSAIPAYI